MFVYQTYSPITGETNSITGKNVIELCASVLNYNNDIKDNTDNEYNVKFYDSNGNTIIDISEAGLYFAITGNSIKETDDNITDVMMNDSQKFWEMTHMNVKSIEFFNPIRMGEVEWDDTYEESDSDEDDHPEDQIEDEDDYEHEHDDDVSNVNKVKII
jgi:hypothetical protein